METRKQHKKETCKKTEEAFEVRVTDLDRSSGIAEGQVIYHYSDRQVVWPRQATKRENLTARGYHHKKRQDQRNGRMLYVKNAKIELEMKVWRGGKKMSYRKNITDDVRKLLGKEYRDACITPDMAATLAERIDNKQVVVFLVDNKLYVEKNRV